MRIHAVIEITPDLSGNLPSELVEIGYRASGSGVVVFALNDVSPEQMDRLLDPIIREVGTSFHGVVYTSIQESIAAARTARVVIAFSAGFRDMLRLASITFETCQAATLRDLETVHRSSPFPKAVQIAS